MSKTGAKSLAIAALTLVVLALLNPKPVDFKAYLASQARAQTAGEGAGIVLGALSKGAAALAGGTGSLYARKNYLVCSTYSFGNKGSLYLGLAKRLFIRLR